MIVDEYANLVLFAAARRRQGALDKFRDAFGLLNPDPETVYEITDCQSCIIAYEESSLERAVARLDINPHLCLDFYFNNADGHIFTFSYRPVGYHVMSIPYGLLSMDQIKSFIREFDILNAWGAGEDSPPPDTVEEIEAASAFASSPFLRFRNGTYLLGNNQVS